LQTLAADEWSGPAPPELEQRLVDAFKEHLKESKASSLKASFSLLSLWRFISRENKWKYATVAVSLAFCFFVSWSLWKRPAANSNTSATIQPKLESPVPIMEMPQATMSPAESERVPDVHPIRRPSRPKLPPQIEWATAETATDFYAIPYVEPFGPQDRVRIVRIQVPYPIMANYGFPVYSDQALSSVQADVMVGDDNVARAIRFVRQWRLPQTQSRNSLLKADY
jgi:hypothetical protein